MDVTGKQAGYPVPRKWGRIAGKYFPPEKSGVSSHARKRRSFLFVGKNTVDEDIINSVLLFILLFLFLLRRMLFGR
jgi:hypothetical protein